MSKTQKEADEYILDALELELLEACEEFWKARKEHYKDPFKSGITPAKLKMYKAMSELFGKYDDGYDEDYRYNLNKC